MKIMYSLMLMMITGPLFGISIDSKTCKEQQEIGEQEGQISDPFVYEDSGYVTIVLPHYFFCKLFKEMACYRIVEESLIAFNDISGKLTQDYPSDLQLMVNQKTVAKKLNLNIIQNYKHLISSHKAVLSEIDLMVKRNLTAIDKVESLSELNAFTRNIYKNIEDIEKQLVSPSFKDEQFLIFLNYQGKFLAGLLKQLGAVTRHEDCSDGVKLKTEEVLKIVEPFVKSIANMVDSVTQGNSKRSLYVDLMRHSLIKKARLKYATLTGEDLETFLKVYGDTLRIEELIWEIGHWWVDAKNSGVATGLFLNTLQYTGPVVELRALDRKLDQYNTELDQMAISEDIKKPVYDSIRAKKSTVSRLSKILDDRGWEGTFSEQQRLADLRLNYLDQYKIGCEETIKVFQKIAANLDQRGFVQAESAYLDIFNACKKRN